MASSQPRRSALLPISNSNSNASKPSVDSTNPKALVLEPTSTTPPKKSLGESREQTILPPTVQTTPQTTISSRIKEIKDNPKTERTPAQELESAQGVEKNRDGQTTSDTTWEWPILTTEQIVEHLYRHTFPYQEYLGPFGMSSLKKKKYRHYVLSPYLSHQSRAWAICASREDQILSNDKILQSEVQVCWKIACELLRRQDEGNAARTNVWISLVSVLGPCRPMISKNHQVPNNMRNIQCIWTREQCIKFGETGGEELPGDWEFVVAPRTKDDRDALEWFHGRVLRDFQQVRKMEEDAEKAEEEHNG